MRVEWEGTALRVLFVCSAGLLRSPTAAFLAQRDLDWNTRAAGVADYALVPVTQQLVSWADYIVCMEQEHKEAICGRFSALHLEDRIRVLGIPDQFRRMEPELRIMVSEALSKLKLS